MTLLMFDSIYVASIPATGMDAVAGYVGGNWPTYKALVARFPHLPALSIAINASEDAQCLDVETGDATPADVPGWLDRQAKAHPGRTPILYTSASQIHAVRAAAGNRHYLLWSAHYGAGEHVCGSCGYPGADATQFADKGPNGEHVDQTAMTPAFLAAFAPKPPAPAPKPTPKPPVVVKPTPKPAPKPAPTVVLQSGSKGAAVQRLQLGLNRCFPAYSHLTVDGNFGPATDAVVKEFQRRSGLMADGVVGTNTRTALGHSGVTF